MVLPASKIISFDQAQLQREEKQTPQLTLQKNKRRLHLLTYNIQTGIATNKYHHYVTHSWKHLLPYAERIRNIGRIAQFITEYDFVGLQEVDAGSLRSGFINITEYLAAKSQFPYWYNQTNRDLGKIARNGLGMLSKLPSSSTKEYKLPGMIPGRGVMAMQYGSGDNALMVMTMHLALGKRTRLNQLAFISELIQDYKNLILMGDLNCTSDSVEMEWLMNNTDLTEPVHGLYTFPSWQPFRNLDHILVSPTLKVEEVKVLNVPFSDHLPLSMVVTLPDDIMLD